MTFSIWDDVLLREAAGLDVAAVRDGTAAGGLVLVVAASDGAALRALLLAETCMETQAGGWAAALDVSQGLASAGVLSVARIAVEVRWVGRCRD
jgi:hypothetical protein